MFGGKKTNHAMHSMDTQTNQSIGQEYLLRGRTSAVVKINKDFLIACLFGWLAWKLWHVHTEFYGVVLLSLLFGIVTISAVMSALIQIGTLYARERMIAAYIAQGVKPKTSKLAGGDALDKAGMR